MIRESIACTETLHSVGKGFSLSLKTLSNKLPGCGVNFEIIG
jgi:hypothetical protein